MKRKNYDIKDVIFAFGHLLRVRRISNARNDYVYEDVSNDVKNKFAMLIGSSIVSAFRTGKEVNFVYDEKVSNELRDVISNLPKLPEGEEYCFKEQTFLRSFTTKVDKDYFASTKFKFSSNIVKMLEKQ